MYTPTFTNGLDPIIRKEVFCMRPNGLDEMIEAAQLVEDRLEETLGYLSKNGLKEGREGPRSTEKKFERTPTRTIAWEEKPAAVRREPGYRRLTDAELRARREKGLCYRCDEKYSLGHRCKNKELRLLLLADEEEEEAEAEEVETEPLVEMTETVELSLNSVVGLTTPGTMKIKGMLEGREIVILIDCGATHNFIALKLVAELKLRLTETTRYGVVMGSGEAVQGKGMCPGVVVSLPEFTFADDFLPLELGHLDMVLGMQWLRKQGTMKIDWKNLTMAFAVGDSKVILKGDPTLNRMEITLKMLAKTWKPEDQGFLIEFDAMSLEGEEGQGSGQQP